MDDDNVVAFHIVGDAFVDFFSFLDGDWPERGGDATLNQPIQTYAGGSSTNTTTHLNALLRHFSSQSAASSSSNGSEEATATTTTTTTELVLHTILNPDDHFGKVLLRHAKEHDFPLVNCKQDDDTSATGHCVAIVAGQERSFMTYRGCVDNFHADHLDVDSIIDSSDAHVHVHVAGLFNLPGFQNGRITRQIQRIRQCRAEKFPHRATVVSLVPQHDATKKWDGGVDQLAPLLDFLIMNDLEAMHIMQQGKIRRGRAKTENGSSNGSRLGHHHHNNGSSAEIATTTTTTPSCYSCPQDAENLIQDCAIYFGELSPHTCVVLTRGPSGAVALLGGTIVASQTTVKVKPVDPTGAGDSFSAGFLHGLWDWRRQMSRNGEKNRVPSLSSSGGSSSKCFPWPPEALQQALLWGCAMGTSSVLVRGASIPSSKDEILRSLTEIEKVNGLEN